MLGNYWKTISRNEQTGETVFYLKPELTSDYADKEGGCIECHGRTDLYEKGAALDVEGEFKDGCLHVGSIRRFIKGDDKEKLKKMFPDIPDKILSEIFKADTSVFEQCEDIPVNETAEKYSDSKIPVMKMLYTLKGMKEREKLFHLFLEYEVPLESLDLFTRKKTTLEQFLKNPYAYMYAGGFRAADAIAKDKIQIDPYDKRRLYALIYNALAQTKNNGNTYISWPDLKRRIEYICKTSSYPKDFVPDAFIFWCLKSRPEHFHIEMHGGEMRISSTKIWKEERTIESHVDRILRTKTPLCKTLNIKEAEEEIGITLNEGQREAINLLKTSGIKIITGPPGSGKTKLMQAITYIFKKNFPNKKIKMAATTGTAAQIMRKSCDAQLYQPTTVHKMLEIRPYGKDYGKIENNQLSKDFIIVDEVSMMDTTLCSLLLSAIKNGAILLLIGDVDQLESVGYGNVLGDMINSGVIETYYLTEVMRQSGTIPLNAEKINKGISDLITDESFHIMRFSDEQEMTKALLKNIGQNTDNSLVLSPVKKGTTGVRNLNRVIQKSIWGDRTPDIISGHYCFYKGDKVMLTRNNYTQEYINGDVGELTMIDQAQINVQLPDKLLELPRNCLQDLQPAYSITIHKSQGSEKDNVHILITEDASNMLTKKLLYTAVTRAREKVFIYTMGNALEQCIQNKRRTNRITSLFKQSKKGDAYGTDIL